MGKKMSRILFVDTEVSTESGRVCDFGAVNAENEKLHTKSEKENLLQCRGA